MCSLRLKGFDYSAENSAYFITARFRGEIDHDVRTRLYSILLELFEETAFSCEALVVLVDHAHLIATKEGVSSQSLPDMMGIMKSKSTYILKKQGIIGESIWQEGYYDHVIRNEEDLLEKTMYIINNPVRANLSRTSTDYDSLYVKGMFNGATQGRPLRGKWPLRPRQDVLNSKCNIDSVESFEERVAAGLASADS